MTYEERRPGLVPVRMGERLAQAIFWTGLLLVALMSQGWIMRHWPAGWLGATLATLADGTVVVLLLILAPGHWSRYAAGRRWLRHNERYKAALHASLEAKREQVARDPALRARVVASLEAYQAETHATATILPTAAVSIPVAEDFGTGPWLRTPLFAPGEALVNA